MGRKEEPQRLSNELTSGFSIFYHVALGKSFKLNSISFLIWRVREKLYDCWIRDNIFQMTITVSIAWKVFTKLYYVLYYWILMSWFLRLFCLHVGFSSAVLKHIQWTLSQPAHVWQHFIIAADVLAAGLVSLLYWWSYIYFISLLVIQDKGDFDYKSVTLFKLLYKVRKPHL